MKIIETILEKNFRFYPYTYKSEMFKKLRSWHPVPSLHGK